MKRTLTTLKSLSALFVLFVLTNCGGNVVGNGVVPDTTMLGLLCPPGKDIFTGSDGAISVPVSEGKSLWIWGDAFMGEVVDNQRGDSVSTPLIYGNLFVELDGERAGPFAGERPDIRSRSSRATVSMANRPSTGPIMGSFGTGFSTHIWCGSFLTPCCGSTRTRFPISGCAFPIMS